MRTPKAYQRRKGERRGLKWLDKFWWEGRREKRIPRREVATIRNKGKRKSVKKKDPRV